MINIHYYNCNIHIKQHHIHITLFFSDVPTVCVCMAHPNILYICTFRFKITANCIILYLCTTCMLY